MAVPAPLLAGEEEEVCLNFLGGIVAVVEECLEADDREWTGMRGLAIVGGAQ